MAGTRGAGASRGRQRKRGLRLIPLSLALLVLLVLAMVGYYWFVVRPWTAPPDVSERELAALWEAVVRNATTPVDTKGPRGELMHFVSQVEEAAELDMVVESWRETGRLDRQARNDLEANRDIGERLVRWMAEEGGFGEAGACTVGEDLPALTLFDGGLIALAQADVVDGGPTTEERLRSVLRLARMMRRGAGPVHFMAGLRLAEHTAQAAKRMDALDVLRAHPEEAPRAAEIWRMVNIEAFCVDDLLERNFGELTRGWPPVTPATRAVPRSWIEVGPSFFRRERAMVRWWWGERIAAATPVSLNPPRLAEALRLPDDLDELPQSLVLRIVAANLAPIVIEAGNGVRSYRETVGLPAE